jgi:hypothetical protein
MGQMTQIDIQNPYRMARTHCRPVVTAGAKVYPWGSPHCPANQPHTLRATPRYLSTGPPPGADTSSKPVLLRLLHLMRHAGEQQFHAAPRRFGQQRSEHGSLGEPHVPAALPYGLNDLVSDLLAGYLDH